MRGMELPTVVLIAIVAALIGGVALIYLFTQVYGPIPRLWAIEAAKSSGCRQLLADCSVSPADIKGLDISLGPDGMPGTADDTLQALCEQHMGCTTGDKVKCCKAACGCRVE